MKIRIASALVLTLCVVSIGWSQENLTIDRIYNSSEFSLNRFGPAKWIENGKFYTTLEASESFSGARDIIKYNTLTGEREILIDAEQLVPAGANAPLSIRDYSWSHDKNTLLIFTNTERVWRYHTRGDYWIYNINDRKLKQIADHQPESSLMFTKFSPDDSKIAYVSKHNVYVEDLNTGETVAITKDGTDKIINGTFDWAYEEEFGARDGFRWSPDGKHIAYWQVDATDIRVFNMINYTDSVYSHNVPVQYPKVGEDPSNCKIGYASADGGETTWLSIPGDQKQNYLPRMMWSPDAKKIFAQQINRKQNTNKVWSYDLATADPKNIFTDTDKAWLDVVDDWIWLNKGKEFTWLSERDGWRHFYRVSADGSGEKLVTRGEYDAMSIEEIDTEGGFVYFTATPDDATKRYLYRVPIKGSDKPQRLSPLDQTGSHSYQIANGGKYAIHTFSNINTPPVISIVSLPKHRTIKTLETNEKVKMALEETKTLPIEFFKVKISEDVELDGYIARPSDFDESKKYPVFFYVYGEPCCPTVVDRWGGSRSLWFKMIAEQGYIVISVDNRGVNIPKGRDWRKSIYRKIGVLNSGDQAAAAKEIMKWDFVDPDRIGVWGWSGGGSMTLNLLFRYPEIYKMGMSVAPVGNQLLYDNIYQERFMGLSSENREDFIEGSPVTYAHNLKGDLLIVHGTGDDNVHYQNTEVVINELIRNNIQFDMMAYPNRSHGIYEGVNTSRHLQNKLTQYLLEHLEPGGKEISIPKR